MLVGALCVAGWWRKIIRSALSLRISRPSHQDTVDGHRNSRQGEVRSQVVKANNNRPKAPRDAATYRHPEAESQTPRAKNITQQDRVVRKLKAIYRMQHLAPSAIPGAPRSITSGADLGRAQSRCLSQTSARTSDKSMARTGAALQGKPRAVTLERGS
jgi:hypothetical protein